MQLSRKGFLFAIALFLPSVESFLLQSLQQLHVFPRLNEALALLLNFYRHTSFLIFEFPDFVPCVQAVGIQTLQFPALHRRLPQHRALALGTLSSNLQFFLPQRFQISAQLLQLQLFERRLPLAPVLHAVQRKLEPFHSVRLANSLNLAIVFSNSRPRRAAPRVRSIRPWSFPTAGRAGVQRLSLRPPRQFA
jgi:hypothetical protein